MQKYLFQLDFGSAGAILWNHEEEFAFDSTANTVAKTQLSLLKVPGASIHIYRLNEIDGTSILIATHYTVINVNERKQD